MNFVHDLATLTKKYVYAQTEHSWLHTINLTRQSRSQSSVRTLHRKGSQARGTGLLTWRSDNNTYNTFSAAFLMAERHHDLMITL